MLMIRDQQPNSCENSGSGSKSTGLASESGLWETVPMANKRTKADKAQRQANQLEKRADTHPEQTPKKPKAREDFSQAAARIVKEATEQK